jgi:hypothetical protein
MVNRDPIGEEGKLNLYGFVGNSPVNLVDSLWLFGTAWQSYIDTLNRGYCNGQPYDKSVQCIKNGQVLDMIPR